MKIFHSVREFEREYFPSLEAEREQARRDRMYREDPEALGRLLADEAMDRILAGL